MTKNKSTEDINFDINFTSEYYKKPPHAKIFVNEVCKFSDFITNDKQKICFTEKLNFNENYTLKIIRSNADNKKHVIDGKIFEQCLHLDKVIIDNIDCEWLLYENSFAIPEYPVDFIEHQAKLGLPHITKGYSKTFTFNTEWYFNFTSPFYIFIMKCMGGGIY